MITHTGRRPLIAPPFCYFQVRQLVAVMKAPCELLHFGVGEDRGRTIFGLRHSRGAVVGLTSIGERPSYTFSIVPAAADRPASSGGGRPARPGCATSPASRDNRAGQLLARRGASAARQPPPLGP